MFRPVGSTTHATSTEQQSGSHKQGQAAAVMAQYEQTAAASEPVQKQNETTPLVAFSAGC